MAAKLSIKAFHAQRLQRLCASLTSQAGGGKPVGLVLGPQGVSRSYAARDVAFGFGMPWGYFALTLGGRIWDRVSLCSFV